MRRRALLKALGATVAAGPSAVFAQSNRIYRVGLLSASVAVASDSVKAIRFCERTLVADIMRGWVSAPWRYWAAVIAVRLQVAITSDLARSVA